MIGCSSDGDEVLLEAEAFVEPVGIFRYSAKTNQQTLWAKKNIPFDPANYGHSQVWYTSKDGTQIPMYLVGRRDVLDKTGNPTIMTSYGGFGTSMTPQFSVFAAFLMERGCLFALPNIRGGSEFGAEWHDAAKRHNRQTAYDDFLCAAEWLLQNRSHPSAKARDLRRIELRFACRCRTYSTAGSVSRGGLHGSDAGHAAVPPV